LGNFITDSIINWYARNFETIGGWTDASIAIMHASNIRESINPSENITRADANHILPVNNKIAIVDINGLNLLNALEHAVNRYDDQNIQPSEFLQMSGLQVQFDVNNAKGHRVISAKVLCTMCSLPEYQDVISNKNYKVLMPESLAMGGEGFNMFTSHITEVLNDTEIDAFASYLRMKSPIYPARESRILIKDFVNPSEDIIGSTRVFLNANCSNNECNLGNFIADAMVDDHAGKYTGTDGWTDASIAIIQGSQIKSSIDHSINNGRISRSDVLNIFSPTPNNLQMMTLNGQQLVDLLEYSVSTYEEHNLNNQEFLQVSGMQIIYDVSKPSGHRLIDVKVLCSQCTVPKLEDVNKTKSYKVIIQSILATDYYKNGIANMKIEDLNTTDVNAFLRYLRKKSPIYPAVEWRIIIGDNHTTLPTTTSRTSSTTQGAANLKISMNLLIFVLILFSYFSSR
jgi:2',3'-cyclic-nucleotide 2'-phosphodiesterase (5'-nucleotidase family)